jgi:membrane protein DedA with SNARE-associated domain
MSITVFVAEYATKIIEITGYFGVFSLMTMESMVFPVPSEAVMPFAGFLVATGNFSMAGVIFASTLGSIVGSFLSYWIGKYGGKPFIERYGKYFLLNKRDLEVTEKFFNKYGSITILICRFIPVVRHLISLPAGIGRMNVLPFFAYTVIGAGLWNTFLAYCGLYLKRNWEIIIKYSHIIDIVVVLLLLALFGYFIIHHIKRK